MGEFLQGGDVTGKRAACCQYEGNLHGRERNRAIESQLPGFEPGGGRDVRKMALQSATPKCCRWWRYLGPERVPPFL